MSSATTNKNEVLVAFSEALDVLEWAVEAFSRSITKERGGDFDLLQALWAAQENYREAAAPVTGFNGQKANELWERARVIRRREEEVLERSKRFYDLHKQRRAAHAEWGAQGNGHRTDGPTPISVPQYLGRENKRFIARKAPSGLGEFRRARPPIPPEERSKREVARRARQLVRSGPKGGQVLLAAGKKGGKKK